MKNRFLIFTISMLIITIGCKTLEPAETIYPAMILRIRGTEDTYGKMMDVINKQAHLRNSRIINDGNFFDYTRQMEFEIDMLNAKQLSLLQVELFRIPDVITITVR